MKFSDLTFKYKSNPPGIQAIVYLNSGYKVSIVRGKYTYGGIDGFYEMYIYKQFPSIWNPIDPLSKRSLNNIHTYYRDLDIVENEAIGYLTEDKVVKIIECLKCNEGVFK